MLLLLLLNVFHFEFALPVSAIAVIAVIALNALAPPHTRTHAQGESRV